MALPPWVSFALTFVKPILMFLGGLFIGLLVFMKIAHKLPPRISGWVQNKLLRKAMSMSGGLQMLIQDSDGVLSLADAEYDGQNGGYWANVDGWTFFSSEGEGGGPKWFYGANVVLAYDGLGATADLVSAKIGEEAKLKRRVDERSKAKSVYDQARERYKEIKREYDLPSGEDLPGREDLPDRDDLPEVDLEETANKDPRTDGGTSELTAAEIMENGQSDDENDTLPDYITEYTSYIPERGVVDLRDTLYNAPFHVRPAQFHRVEENAKAGQGTGLNENIIRFGLLITGFMLAVIAFVIMGDGGGASAASGVSLPMGG